MRKRTGMVLAFVTFLSLTGCSGKTLTCDGNLGYDLGGTGRGSAVFKVYHSNTENHVWERLKTFTCPLQKEHFTDVRVEGEEDQVTITLEDNRVEKTEDMESYFTEDIDAYEFTVEGFEGWIGAYRTFEVKDTDGEQFYRLYPVSNEEGGAVYQNLKLDQPYDEGEENLDNILITIQLQ